MEGRPSGDFEHPVGSVENSFYKVKMNWCASTKIIFFLRQMIKENGFKSVNILL